VFPPTDDVAFAGAFEHLEPWRGQGQGRLVFRQAHEMVSESPSAAFWRPGNSCNGNCEVPQVDEEQNPLVGILIPAVSYGFDCRQYVVCLCDCYQANAANGEFIHDQRLTRHISQAGLHIQLRGHQEGDQPTSRDAIVDNEATRCEADQTAYELNGFD
jgi:hypothetical protein